jgi:hypothetical protein
MKNKLNLEVIAGTSGGMEKTILNSPRFIREHVYNARTVYLAPPQDSIRESFVEACIDR